MCSICGMIDFVNRPTVVLTEKMSKSMKVRGPDDSDMFADEKVAFCHNRLSVMDPKNGAQPMIAAFEGREYVIVYNGEIYNSPDLRKDMKPFGAEFKTNCDTETVLWSYIIYGN